MIVANNRFAAKDPHVLNVVINIKSTNFTNFRNANNTLLAITQSMNASPHFKNSLAIEVIR